jgi:hypothetical protein
MRTCLAPLVAAACLLHPPAAGAVEILLGPLVQSPGPGAVVVVFETDVPTVGRAIYGGDGALDRHVESAGPSTRHELCLGSLAPGERIRYRVFASTAHSRVHEFTSPPAAGGDVDFLVFGDNRSTHDDHRAVVDSMLPHVGHALVNTGDLVNRGDLVADWNAFFAIERPLLASTLSFHTVGNHDVVGGGVKNMTAFLVQPSSPHAPERDFFVDLGAARLVFLDNAITASSPSVQRSWLDDVLDEGERNPSTSHLFVIVHQGLHSNGPHGPSKSLLAAGLDDVMRDHGVAMVIAGHDHGYERGIVDGLRYMIAAGGGAPLYKKTVKRGHDLMRAAVHHFVHFRVRGGEVGFDVVLKDGSVLESCVLAPAPQGYSCQSSP